MIASWPCPLPDGGTCDELAVHIGEGSAARILVIPPLFAENNLMRRQLAEVMRRLAENGISCVLPDLPGCNESVQPLLDQTLTGWRAAIASAMMHFEATHVLAVRSGALVVPSKARGWSFAAQDGAKLLRGMIRARTIASKEAGASETSDQLTALGRSEGLVLNGWPISAMLFRELEQAFPAISDTLAPIDQSLVGGAGLWLRAEPGEDADQASALATAILEDLAKPQ